MFEIDEPKTIKQVTRFLEKELDKYTILSKTKFDVKSVDYSKIKVNGSSNNSDIANRYNYIIQVQQRLTCIAPAIKQCSKISQTILNELYINHLPVWKIEALTGYSHTQFYVYKKKACLEFADAFLIEQLNNNITDILDLHVYKDNLPSN